MVIGSACRFGQLRVDSKTNEKTAIPALIDQMDIAGAIVTIDAVLCTTVVAAQIINKNANYILAVKGGNKHLLEQLSDWLGRTNVESLIIWSLPPRRLRRWAN